MLKDINIKIVQELEPRFQLDRPGTPRAKWYSRKEVVHHKLFLSEKKKEESKRPRLGSETTCPESHHDHELDHNVFHKIKRILEKKSDQSDSVPSKIPEDPEIQASTSEDSVSSEEEVKLHSDFSNKRFAFLFELYDKKRASGIRPAMKMKFQPKFRIFGNDSSKGEKEPKSRNHKYSKYLNYDSFKYYKMKKEKAERAKTVESPANSLDVEVHSSSIDPDSEEIDEFERHLYDNKLIEDYLPKGRENFNSAKMMNAIIIRDQHGPVYSENPIHNEEVYEYESQAVKEALEYPSPPHRKISKDHLENYSPEKKARSSKFLLNRLKKRRPDICQISHRTNLGKYFKVKECHRNTRNKGDKVHAGDPLMFNRVCCMRHCQDFYSNFEDKLLEKEHHDLEVPITPNSSPISRLRILLKRNCNHGNAYVEKTKKKVSHHDLINAIWVDGVKGHDFNKVIQKKD